MKLLEETLRMRPSVTTADAQHQRNANRDHNQVWEGLSHNLEPDFSRMAGDNVYTTPLANIMAIENALAARTNPSQDDERLQVFL